MWRGSRCLWTFLGLQSRGAAAGSSRGARRPREIANVATATAAPVPSWAASSGLRKASGVSLRDAEKVAEGEQEQEEEVVGHDQRIRPDPASSAFNIDYLVSLLRQENAKDICVIQLPPEMKYSNFFIVVSGSSTRHLYAMAHYLVKMYKHQKADCDPHVVIEGKDCDDWLCIDFGSIVAHFMLPETREIYELEKLWTLRSYDDQLAQMVPESIPDDFVFGLTSEE